MTPREARFVEEYCVDLNAKQAAIRAGYSERTAKQQGSRLLTRPHVAAAIAEAQERRAATVEVKADEVLRELKVLAFNTQEIRHADKLKALELLGRHLKMFTDKIEGTVGTLEQAVLEAERMRHDRSRVEGRNPLTGWALKPGEQGYEENKEAAQRAAAEDAAKYGTTIAPAPENAPAPAAEPLPVEIEAQRPLNAVPLDPVAFLRARRGVA